MLETNPGYLQTALELGITRFEFQGPQSPLLGRSRETTYLWMGLSGDPTPRPDELEEIVSPLSRGRSLSRRRSVHSVPA